MFHGFDTGMDRSGGAGGKRTDLVRMCGYAADGVGQRVHLLQAVLRAFIQFFDTLTHFTYLILDILGGREEM